MTSIAINQATFISAPISDYSFDKAALFKVSLLHGAMALLLLGSWSAVEHAPVAVKSMSIQLTTAPKPVVKPVEIVKPIEPVVQQAPVELTPEVKPPIVKQDFAFERVKKSVPIAKPKPKPVVKKQVKPIIKPKPELITKPVPDKIEPTIDKPIEQPKQATIASNNRTESPVKKSVNSSNSTHVPSTDNVLKNEQYLPLDKTAPKYPKGALRKDLEGDCTVQYDVDTNGRVLSPKVIGDCHPLFKRPSLAAAKQFRYKPRIIDGKTVIVKNVKNTFEYRIQ